MPKERQAYQYVIDFIDGKFGNDTTQQSPQDKQDVNTAAVEQKVDPSVVETVKPKPTAQPQDEENEKVNEKITTAKVELPTAKDKVQQKESKDGKGRMVETRGGRAKGKAWAQVI